MFFHKKINNDIFLLILLVVRLRLDYDVTLNERYIREPESREVFLGSASAYTQISFLSPYSNIQYPHPKSLEFNEQDEAAILFNRLNYFNSVSPRRSSLIAYYAGSPGAQNAGSSIESSNAEAAASESAPGDASLPTMAEASLDSSGGTSCERETTSSAINQDLSPEDMDLIEILWKQDIDLGVSREAYDSRTSLEVEKLKEVEYTKEPLQEFYVPEDAKPSEDTDIVPDPFAGLNYTVDSETGEFVLDELSGLHEDEISGAHLLDNETFNALNRDSYMPFNDDEAQLNNLTDVFSPGEFPDLMPENYTDSEYILSQIEDIGKELETYIDNEGGSETMYSQPGDVFPSMEDCWPDSTTMLPLLALGSAHQSSFVPLSPRPEPTYPNTNPILPLPNNLPSRSTEGFTGILNATSLDATANEETFHSVPVVSVGSIGASSVGCALAESIATLHNDTDPIPTSSLINTVYNPDLPELLYSNQSLTAPHNELLIHDLFTDEDFPLVAMSSEVNQRTMTEDRIDTSDDSASLASGRVPSVSDCPDWADSCSESSSHHGENQSYSFAVHPRGHFFGHNHNTELYPSTLPSKRHKHPENNDSGNAEIRGAAYEHSNGNDRQYFSIKSEYSDIYENHAQFPSSQEPTYRKFDYSNVRPPSAACNNILQHNHSYHLPFSTSDSRYKPVVRDKSKSLDDGCFNKDEKRAKELKLPISIDDIINLAIDEYNERLSKYELTDQQLNLIRDIRRRGKNKVAAQNCRKRKMDQISSLQQDLDSMQNEKMQLKTRQDHLLQEKHHIEDKYAQLYQIVSQFTNCKPPGSSDSLPVHNSNHMTIPTASDIIMSDDDSDLSRGARTKRKLKK